MQNTPPIRIPVEINLVSPGFWACHGKTVIEVLVVAMVLFLLAYAFFMYKQSCFINTRVLAMRIRALRWSEYLSLETRPNQEGEIKNLIRRHLSFGARAKAWLAANPLVIGIPGKRYVETIAVSLQGSIKDSSLVLQRRRDVRAHLKDPKNFSRYPYKLFCSASSTNFFGIPDAEGRLSGYRIEPSPPRDASPDGTFLPKVVDLTGSTLVKGSEFDRPNAGDFAGWRIGPQ
jgi:hypothetical protein